MSPERSARLRLVTALTLVAACAAIAPATAVAQKNAPVITRDTDRDGVPDIRDRCRNSPAGAVVDPTTGCPPAANAAPPRQTPTRPVPRPADPGAVIPQGQTGLPGVTRPAAGDSAALAQATAVARADSLRRVAFADSIRRAVTDSLRRAGIADSLRRAAVSDSLRRVAVADSLRRQAIADSIAAAQAAEAEERRVAAARAAAAAPTLTAGFAILPYGGSTDAERLEWARDVAVRLDSVLVALIEIFRNTPGAPLRGAQGPDVISTREKNRWVRCRLVHFDMTTYRSAVAELSAEPFNASVERPLQQLASALEAFQATSECDNVSSMLDAPDRWAPWTANYETSATNFYRTWYAQLRTVHEADRAFALALNSALPPAQRIPPLPALPPNPPTVGGPPR